MYLSRLAAIGEIQKQNEEIEELRDENETYVEHLTQYNTEIQKVWFFFVCLFLLKQYPKKKKNDLFH